METTDIILAVGVILAVALLSGVILWSTESWELIIIGLILLGGVYLVTK